MGNAFLHSFAAPSKNESDFIKVVKASGASLWDDNGKEYIDGLASLWLCQVGHGQQEIVDAVYAQMSELATYNTFDPFTNGPAAEVAEMIAARSPHPDGRVFLACSGSEAIDTAVKMARLVGQHRGNNGEKQIILRRTGGYHGTNLGGTSSQGIEANRTGWGDLVPHFIEVSGDDVEDAAKVFAEHGSNVAAVMCEPVQGAGGVNMPSPGYLEGLRRLCDDNDALLVFDEVICGFGRTGSWFGAQTFNVTPDLMTFAKGVTSGYQPLSGVIMSRKVADFFESDVAKFMHGYTYSGHPAACVAGIANINIIERDGLIDRATKIGHQISSGLEAMKADGTVKEVHGVGAIWSVDIGRDAVPVRDAMLDAGVVVRPIGQRIAMCPPLVITDAQITTMMDVLAAQLT